MEKLSEHTYGSHIHMKLRLDNGRTEEIDVFLGKDGNETYRTSADSEADQGVREQIIEAFRELY